MCGAFAAHPQGHPRARACLVAQRGAITFADRDHGAKISFRDHRRCGARALPRALVRCQLAQGGCLAPRADPRARTCVLRPRPCGARVLSYARALPGGARELLGAARRPPRGTRNPTSSDTRANHPPRARAPPSRARNLLGAARRPQRENRNRIRAPSARYFRHGAGPRCPESPSDASAGLRRMSSSPFKGGGVGVEARREFALGRSRGKVGGGTRASRARTNASHPGQSCREDGMRARTSRKHSPQSERRPDNHQAASDLWSERSAERHLHYVGGRELARPPSSGAQGGLRLPPLVRSTT